MPASPNSSPRSIETRRESSGASVRPVAGIGVVIDRRQRRWPVRHSPRIRGTPSRRPGRRRTLWRMSMPYDAPSGPGDSGPEDAYRRWQLLQEQADAEHDALLASDAERDQVCRRLSAAFSEGRITSPELDERTSRALAARTYGDLEDVMVGLELPATTSYRPVMPDHRPPERSVLPRVLFWLVGLVSAPLHPRRRRHGAASPMTTSTLIFGLVMLTLFLPGLVALYRWGHPRT